jgi:3-isopropylmalate/(R)-2-methylmalate dehydratase small subunit
MEPFRTLTGIVAPLDRVNVDTDQIIPKQFLKLTGKTGFGQYLFHDWRYDVDGNLSHGFVLNNPRYRGAKILLTRGNFGCGSSREHAVWALADYGFKALIAPSFADILYNNCFKNGLLPISLNEENIQALFEEVAKQEGYRLEVDLSQQTIRKPNGDTVHFHIEAFRKRCLLEGLDDVQLTLKHNDEIQAYEERLRPFQLVDLSTVNH